MIYNIGDRKARLKPWTLSFSPFSFFLLLCLLFDFVYFNNINDDVVCYEWSLFLSLFIPEREACLFFRIERSGTGCMSFCKLVWL